MSYSAAKQGDTKSADSAQVLLMPLGKSVQVSPLIYFFQQEAFARRQKPESTRKREHLLAGVVAECSPGRRRSSSSPQKKN
jgi:hypothetical protein